MSISDQFIFIDALNKGGISLLTEGRMSQALNLFQESMIRCGDAVREFHDETCPETAPNQEPEPGGACRVQERQERKGPDCRKSYDPFYFISTQPPIEQLVSKYGTNNAFVDWRALQLTCVETMLPADVNSFFMLSFVATYNLALCHQFLGMRPTSSEASRRLSLSKAAKSYEVVHRMMVEAPELQCDLWMLLAVVNNLNCVFYCLHDTKRATLCSQRLTSILMYISNHEEMEMPTNLFDKYFSNAFRWNLRNAQTASAA